MRWPRRMRSDTISKRLRCAARMSGVRSAVKDESSLTIAIPKFCDAAPPCNGWTSKTRSTRYLATNMRLEVRTSHGNTPKNVTRFFFLARRQDSHSHCAFHSKQLMFSLGYLTKAKTLCIYTCCVLKKAFVHVSHDAKLKLGVSKCKIHLLNPMKGCGLGFVYSPQRTRNSFASCSRERMKQSEAKLDSETL